MKTKMTTVRFPEDLLKKIDSKAKALGLSRSKYMQIVLSTTDLKVSAK